MRFIRFFIHNSPIRSTFRFQTTQSKKVPHVRVVSYADDVKLSFSNLSALTIKVSKDQQIGDVLSLIQKKFALIQRRAEYRRIINAKYTNIAHAAIESTEDSEDVCLFENFESGKLIDERIPNIDVWSQVNVLKIGDITYEVRFNTPAVKNMSLPEYIVCGCILRPHFMLECASFDDCIFTWYRSVTNKIDVEGSNMMDWVKVGEGFHYLATSEDVNCYLKVVCSPRNGNQIGSDFASVSKNTVEAGPGTFPFEDRHAYTKTVCENNSFRCVSYNTLANMYVEKGRFRYASEKARDVYYRKQLLIRELLGYNSDIICLQEVQERVFDYDFSPVLNKAGYDGFYQRKGGKRYEGLATFFRSSKFRVLFNKGIILNEIVLGKKNENFVDLLNKVCGNNKDMSKLLAQDTVLQAVLLENIKNPENKVLIANTHLYSHKDKAEVRLIQAALCICYVEHLMKEQSTKSIGILFCGDFNSLPNSEAYNFITSGEFQCCPSWRMTNINSSEDTAAEDTTLRHNLSLESACGIPSYTNFTDEFHGCLDYIFYNKDSLEVTDVVPMPSHEKVTAQVALPSEYFPSDHLALVCTLKWKK